VNGEKIMIPPVILAWIIAGGWVLSGTFAYVGGSREKTTERLTHPVGLAGTIASAGGLLAATVQLHMSWVDNFMAFGVTWIIGLVAVVLAGFTPSFAFDEGVKAGQRRRRDAAEDARAEAVRAEKHRDLMAKLTTHHNVLDNIRHGRHTTP
jgi:hypothetical protein